MSNGRQGISLSFRVQDPEKMSHITAVIRFSDMVDNLDDVWIQMKLRKVRPGCKKISYAGMHRTRTTLHTKSTTLQKSTLVGASARTKKRAHAFAL